LTLKNKSPNLWKPFQQFIQVILPPTIYDIAKAAHVGIGTVSRVLNNHPNVSLSTRTRVLTIANRLNWQPHPYARGLARQKTNSILAVVPFFSTYFFVEVLRGVQSKLGEMEYDLILYGINDPHHVEELLKKNSMRMRVDGVLFLSMSVPENFVEQYARLKIPIVLVDTKRDDLDSVYVENVKGAHTATAHLVSLGHKRIGMLSASMRSQPVRERLEGFKHAMDEAGIEIDPRLTISSNSTVLDGFTRECGYELMKDLLRLGSERPTAILVSSDIQASGALWAVEEAGLHCPEDIAIVGFDDIELASHLRLTTMRQPMFDMGVLAARKLEERLSGSQLPPANNPFVPELIIRETCGAKHQPHQAHVAQLTA
jgi:LacI family transcriptional regulator